MVHLDNHIIMKTLCENRGIPHYINPAYTSQKCSKCGHTHKKNRTTTDGFKCQCGYEAVSHKNAADNIAKVGGSIMKERNMEEENKDNTNPSCLLAAAGLGVYNARD